MGLQAWVFDLDNTLYPASASVYPAIGVRMSAYIARALGCDAGQADEIRERYFHLYGATVLGLAKHHAIDAADFLHDVHQVDLSDIGEDAALTAMIDVLPGRKYIFTNGDEAYAHKVAQRLGVGRLMHDIVGIDAAMLKPKPDAAAFEALIARTGIDPHAALYFDDHARNLETAHELGFATALIGEAPKPAFATYAARDIKAMLRTLAA
jgi:putative hydrolase of the HAD superfamily